MDTVYKGPENHDENRSTRSVAAFAVAVIVVAVIVAAAIVAAAIVVGSVAVGGGSVGAVAFARFPSRERFEDSSRQHSSVPDFSPSVRSHSPLARARSRGVHDHVQHAHVHFQSFHVRVQLVLAHSQPVHDHALLGLVRSLDVARCVHPLLKCSLKFRQGRQQQLAQRLALAAQHHPLPVPFQLRASEDFDSLQSAALADLRQTSQPSHGIAARIRLK